MAGIWQVDLWDPWTGQTGRDYWLDFWEEWNRKLELVYRSAVEREETDNAIVLLYHDEAAEDYVMYEVDVRRCIQRNVTTGRSRQVRRVIITRRAD